MDNDRLENTVGSILESGSIDQAVAAYIKLRDSKKILDEAHKQKISGISSQLSRIENWIMSKANEQGVNNFNTPHGTAYKQLETSVSVADWEVSLKFVQDNGLWNMLERRLNKTAVMEYRNETKMLPPGVNVSEIYVINVRRSG